MTHSFKIYLLFLIFLLSLACKSISENVAEDSIEKIRFTHVGGKKDGGDFGVEINKDSTYFREYNKVLEKEKTSDKLWNKLFTSISVKKIAEIKSCESRNYVDDVDLRYEIETKEKKYSFLLCFGNSREKEILAFKSIIDLEFARLYQKWTERTSH
jgi:hypothetical protein